MCLYCYCGDLIWKWNPPWNPSTPGTNPIPPQTPHPFITTTVPSEPISPISDWKLEKLKDYLKLLKEIKELEDKIGCPCPAEREKPDYIKMFEERIAALEKPKCKCGGDCICQKEK